MENPDTELNPEDQNKIKQLNSLLQEGRLDKMTVIKFILKLSLKLLSNHRFMETSKIFEQIFKNELSVRNLFEPKVIKDFDLDQEDTYFIQFIEDLNKERFDEYRLDEQQIGVYYVILLSKLVLKCYFNFLRLVKNIQSKKTPFDTLNKVLKVIDLLLTFRRRLMILEILLD